MRPSDSVRRAQDGLGVVVEDLVDVAGRQACLAEVVEVLPVRLEGEQHRIVAPGHEVVGAERLPGAEDAGVRAVTDDVVVEAARGDARALWKIRMLARRL